MSILGILLTVYIVSALICFVCAVVGKIGDLRVGRTEHSRLLKLAIIGFIPILGTLVAVVFTLDMAIDTALKKLGDMFGGKK